MKLLLPFLLLLCACAVVVHPTGGDLDILPPQAIRVYPDSQSLNFKDKEIRIYFDEFFEIKDPNAILISPPPTQKPKIEVVNKYLRIQFKEPLRHSTTYTVQLIEAIQDIHEKEILPNYKLSFSTGDQIDTAYIHGKVEDNYTKEPQKNFTIAVFHSDISSYPDSLIYPLYLSKTAENGTFTLSGIRPIPYTLYAFNDINNNKLIDLGEDVGYHSTPVFPFDTITLSTAKNILNAPLITYSPIPQDIRSFILPLKIPKGGKVNILSSQKSFDKSQVLFTDQIHSDSLRIIDFIKSDQDTQVTYFAEFNQTITDTFKVRFKNITPNYQVTIENKGPLPQNQALKLKTHQAIRDVKKKNTILLMNDTVTLDNFILSSTPFQIDLNFESEVQTNYLLILKDSSIHYYDGTFSKTDTIRFTTAEKNRFGDAAILFSNEKNSSVEIQLLKDIKEEPLFFKTTNSDSVYFSHLPSGEYFVRLIYLDSLSKPNQIIPFKIQPSKVHLNTAKLTIRGGWVISDFILNNKED